MMIEMFMKSKDQRIKVLADRVAYCETKSLASASLNIPSETATLTTFTRGLFIH